MSSTSQNSDEIDVVSFISLLLLLLVDDVSVFIRCPLLCDILSFTHIRFSDSKQQQHGDRSLIISHTSENCGFISFPFSDRYFSEDINRTRLDRHSTK